MGFSHIFSELYGFNVYFMRSSREVYEKEIKSEFDISAPSKPISNATFEVYDKTGSDVGVIWVSDESGMKHLIHECFHCTHYIMQDRGMFLHDASEEAYAYLLEWIFDKAS